MYFPEGWVIMFCKIWSSLFGGGMWHRIPWYKNINCCLHLSTIKTEFENRTNSRNIVGKRNY